RKGSIVPDDLCDRIRGRHAPSSAAIVRDAGRRGLPGARAPGLLLVREPDELGFEREHAQLAFGVRLVELAEPHRDVAADDERAPAWLDDDHLHAPRVTRPRDE